MDLLTTEQAAALLKFKPRTLDNWRYRGVGPAWVKAEGGIRYRREDLEEWVLKRREGLTPETLEDARLAELEKEAR